MKNMTRREAIGGMGLLSGSVLLLGSGCATNPVTGKSQFMLMSEAQEIRMGQQAHADIVKQYGLYNDTSIGNWFTERGSSMSKVTHRPNLPWTFTVLDSPVVNAFAVPGGYVYVTRGILANFNDEAQFAGVLGHECGHVTARHTASRYSKAQLANLGVAIGTIFSETFTQYAQLASFGTTLLFLKYSRDDERQADQLGVEYSSQSGYDAIAMSEFFYTLERMRPEGAALPEWTSTHPDPGDRIKATRTMAQKFQQTHTDITFARNAEFYLDLVDGLVYGDDPRQGYVKNGMFHHPQMSFSFPVPDGWKVTNMPAEVRMMPENEEGMLIFTVAEGDTPAGAASSFAEANGVTAASQESITVNSMSGYRVTGTMGDEEQQYGIVSNFISMDGKVFAFHGLTSVSGLPNYTDKFDSTARGFSRLTDSSLINVSPRTIEIRKVPGTRTFAGALNEFGVPQDQHENLAVLNGRELNDSLSAGTRLKIIS